MEELVTEASRSNERKPHSVPPGAVSAPERSAQSEEPVADLQWSRSPLLRSTNERHPGHVPDVASAC
jgi:hypothetical protein